MALLVSQSLAGGALLAAFSAIPLFGRQVLVHCWRLVCRTRWLLLSLLLIFSWGGTGEPLWSGSFAPTRQGIEEALTHLGHLLLAFGGVAVLRTTTPPAGLMTAIYHLSKPLRCLGIDPDRGLIRLLLVLHYMETSPRPWDWRQPFAEPSSSMTITCFDLEDASLTRTDYLAIAAGISATVIFFCLG
ncbi:MAG: hypothetical protein RKO68_10535 [Candidatus Accumulibacter sp.]|nr:hypothetical protein [Accumulibacter sp.]